MNYITPNNKNQVLKDISSTGKRREWAIKKYNNEYLQKIYKAIDNENKCKRLQDCSTFLTFTKASKGMKLKKANFCRVRLCPICTWRRSMKLFSQIEKILDEIKNKDNKEYGFAFLTLTVKNVKPEDLATTIDDMMSSYQRIFQLKEVESIAKGTIRTLEITHNLNPDSEFYNTYHPHFHVVLMVNKSYFTDTERYVTQEKWTKLWKQSARLDYTPIVDIRRIKSKDKKIDSGLALTKAIAETSKYAVKDSDYLVDDFDLACETVRLLDVALANRRFIAYGGLIKKIHRQLKMEDVDTSSNLINIDNDALSDDDGELITYVWNSGYRNYFNFIK